MKLVLDLRDDPNHHHGGHYSRLWSQEEWEQQPAWFGPGGDSSDASESDDDGSSSDGSSLCTDDDNDLADSGAPSWPCKHEASEADEKKVGESTQEHEMQEHEALDLDSVQGESDAESEDEHCKGHNAKPSAETGAGEEDLDSMSDATDCSDIFHIEALPQGLQQSGLRCWETYEDRVQGIVDRVASHMREYPLMPPDVSDPTAEKKRTGT